jgi:hypothetical protein
MKTTLDIPDVLMKQVKLRALQEGRKLKDAVADLLHKGLAVPSQSVSQPQRPLITKDRKTGLPVIACQEPASPQAEMTPDRIAEILLAQEVEWQHAAGR